MAVRTQPTLSPGMSARIAEAAALSLSSFRKRYRSSYETPSPSSSPTLLVRKRYRGTSELILDTDSKEDELGEEDNEEDKSSDADDERESQGLDDKGQGLDDEGQGLDDEGQGLEDEGPDDEGQGLDDEGQGLDDEGQGLEDEGPGMKEEEAAPKGQQQAILVVDTVCVYVKPLAPSTYEVRQSSRSVPEQEGAERISEFRQPTLITWVDPEDGRVYTNIPTYVPLIVPVQTPPSPEWSLGSLLVSPSSSVVPSPIASPVANIATTISVDEDHILEVGAQLKLLGSILHDHTQHLDALPLTLFEGYDKDLRKLYTRSGAFRDKIFLQRYRFRSLEQEQERATRENHNLRRQLAEERRERLELTYRVVRMERR
ncbi:hypothetical protein Tco_1014559 [Tanacetum coccineum]